MESADGKFYKTDAADTEQAKNFHYNFPDPAKATGTDAEIKQAFRKVRELIKNYARAFVAENI